MFTNVLLDQKGVNICEDGTTREFWKSTTRVGARQERGKVGGDGGTIEWKSSEVNTRALY